MIKWDRFKRMTLRAMCAILATASMLAGCTPVTNVGQNREEHAGSLTVTPEATPTITITEEDGDIKVSITPAPTETPEVDEPVVEVTPEPVVKPTESPEITEAPEVTPTEIPVEQKPEVSETPEITEIPEPSPTEIPEAEITVAPLTITPTPGLTEITPEPTQEPERIQTPTPSPTSTPVPTATPTPTSTPTPKPTSTPTPKPTATPVPTATPTPSPTSTPKPTATPTPAVVNPNSTVFTVPGTGKKDILVNMRIQIVSGGMQIKLNASEWETADLTCGWQDKDGNYTIIPNGWKTKWRLEKEAESCLYISDRSDQPTKAMIGADDKLKAGSELDTYIYCDLIDENGKVVYTLSRVVKVYSPESSSSNTSSGNNNNNNTSNNNTSNKEDTNKPSNPSTQTGTYKYTTDQGEEISVSAKEYAILTKDYNEVSAKDIIRYYVDIEQYGSYALQETEAECQMILDKVDAALDEVWKYGGEYITGDPYFSIPYRLALQCEMLMSLTYDTLSNFGRNTSSFMNNNGIRQLCNTSIAYSYSNASFTGTGKYFLEAFTNYYETDCQGGDFACQLVINRAAHRAGLDKSELYAYGVDQGSDHRISIINIEGYYAAYGYNIRWKELKSTSHIPGFSMNKIILETQLMPVEFWDIGSSGELVRRYDKEYLRTAVGGIRTYSTDLYVSETGTATKIIIPDSITKVNILDANTSIKSIVIGENVEDVSMFTWLMELEELEILSSNVRIELNLATPWAQNQLKETGSITIPKGMNPHEATYDGRLWYVTEDEDNKIVYEELNEDTWESVPTYPWGWTLRVSKDELWWANWCTYWGVPYELY